MRILLVEDEQRIARNIKQGLVQEGYAVDVAHDGESGFDLASSESYDLILLDLMLPGMDGLTICRQLRAQNNHTPILMLTAKTLVKDKVAGLDTGADDYLPKPFEFAELLARIRALLRRPRQAQSPVLQVGNLTLDPANMDVQINNNPVELSKREFSLLEYLMRNIGRILSKDQIIEHVWNFDADVLPNTVEVYIKHLRKKIEQAKHDAAVKIETVRGFGYRIK